MIKLQLRILYEYDPATEQYSATIPELNYISSFGETKAEAFKNLKEAIALMLEPIPEQFLQTSGRQYETEEANVWELIPA